MKGDTVKKAKRVGKKLVTRKIGPRTGRVAKKGIMFFVTPEVKATIKKNADASAMNLSHYLQACATSGIRFKITHKMIMGGK